MRTRTSTGMSMLQRANRFFQGAFFIRSYASIIAQEMKHHRIWVKYSTRAHPAMAIICFQSCAGRHRIIYIQTRKTENPKIN